MNREKRARLYFRLMDITFVLAVVGFSVFVIEDIIGITLLERSHPVHFPLSIFFSFMNFLMPAFLLVARFMRDEYAELLWQRSIAMMAYVVAIIPAFLMIGAIILEMSGAKKPVGFYAFLYYEKASIMAVIGVSWMAYMLLFVAIFQFVRWRDSR
jgi:hypothetical protein